MAHLDTLPHPLGFKKDKVTNKPTTYVVEEGKDYGRTCQYFVRTTSGQDIANSRERTRYKTQILAPDGARLYKISHKITQLFEDRLDYPTLKSCDGPRLRRAKARIRPHLKYRTASHRIKFKNTAWDGARSLLLIDWHFSGRNARFVWDGLTIGNVWKPEEVNSSRTLNADFVAGVDASLIAALLVYCAEWVDYRYIHKLMARASPRRSSGGAGHGGGSTSSG